MKKIVMIFAAMAAVLSSCSKSGLESVSVNDGKDIVLNISVSNPGASDTKALIKSAWVENDEISIWYDGNTGATPDLVVTYNGEKWIQKEGATVSGSTPSTGTGKYAKALYNGTVKVASKDDYTYENSTLTFSIENWTFLTEVQVVVTGLTSTSAGSYTLACDKFTPLASTGDGYTVGSDAITASTGNKGAAVTGISNTDGVAFVFATADYSATAAAYKFTLTDNTSTPAVTKEYTATTTKINGTTGSMISIKALTIANIKFTAPGPEYVVMKMGSTGSKTLKWATMNVGATTVAGSGETCYGDYYAWGETKPYYATRTWDKTNKKWIFNEWNDNKSSGYGWKSYCGSSSFQEWTPAPYNTTTKILNSGNDAATQKRGTGWRMPTSQEFKDLYDACLNGSYNKTANPSGASASVGKGVYWCTSYDGVAGCLFCDGNNRLFFPAAGYGYGTGLDDAGVSGTYWSSSLYTGSTFNAYDLFFYSDLVYPQNFNRRCNGFSVRPVSD